MSLIDSKTCNYKNIFLSVAYLYSLSIEIALYGTIQSGPDKSTVVYCPIMTRLSFWELVLYG